MDEQTFQTKFNELLAKIKELPDADRNRLNELADETKQRRDRIQASVGELQESLDYLRLSVKYLGFDLKPTRRENSYLRKLVEQSNRAHEQNPRQDPPRNENKKRSRRDKTDRNRQPDNDNFLEDDGTHGAD